MASLGSNANLFSRAHRIDVASAITVLRTRAGEEDLRAELERLREENERKKVEKAPGVVVEKVKREYIGISVPPVPSIPKKVSAADFLKYIKNIKGLVQSLPVINKQTNTPFTNPLSYNAKGYDKFNSGIVIKMLQDQYYDSKLDAKAYYSRFPVMFNRTIGDQVITLKGFEHELSLWIYCSGTEKGLITRLKAGLSAVDRDTPLKTWYFDDFKKSMVYSGNATLLSSSMESITYSPQARADYGLPYPGKKKGEMTTEMVILAADWLRRFKDKDAVMKEFGQRQEEVTMMIKNKAELIKLKDFHTKVRPYYVVPAHLGLLYSNVFELINLGRKTFLDDPDSLTMCGFSWAHGGAKRLIEKVQSLAPGEALFFNYSDDIHCFFRDLDGKVFMFCPDARFLDMSLRRCDFNPIYQILSVYLKGRLDSTWENVLRTNVFHAMFGGVLFDHGLCFNQTRGMRSGVPGTSVIGGIFVENGIHHTKHLFRSIPKASEAEIKERLSKFVIGMRECGMVIKDETLVVREVCVKPPSESKENVVYELPLPVLGQYVRYTFTKTGSVGVAYPRPDYMKILVSLSRPGDVPSEVKDKFLYFLARTMGLAVSGGWSHPQVYSILKQCFDECIRQLQVVPPDSGQVITGATGPVQVAYDMDDTSNANPDGAVVDTIDIIVGRAADQVGMEGLGILSPIDRDEVIVSLGQLFGKGFPSELEFRSIYTDEEVSLGISTKVGVPVAGLESVYEKIEEPSTIDYNIFVEEDYLSPEEMASLTSYTPHKGETIIIQSKPVDEPSKTIVDPSLDTVIPVPFVGPTPRSYSPGHMPPTPQAEHKAEERSEARRVAEEEKRELIRRAKEMGLNVSEESGQSDRAREKSRGRSRSRGKRKPGQRSGFAVEEDEGEFVMTKGG